MSGNFFDTLYNPMWKRLTDQGIEVVSQQILKYFINPLVKIESPELIELTYGGIKVKTFQVLLDDKLFRFVPGQKGVVLGWEPGLPQKDWLKRINQEAMRESIGHVIADLSIKLPDETVTYLSKKLAKAVADNEGKDMNLLLEIEKVMSPLRTVDISPMLVEATPEIAGYEPCGEYKIITGQINLSQEDNEHRDEIVDVLLKEQSGMFDLKIQRERLTILDYLIFLRSKEDRYRIYHEKKGSYSDIVKRVDKQGMDLMTEDEWEYCCGAGTRRLFRWQDLGTSDTTTSGVKNLMNCQNMFGLKIGLLQDGPELIHSTDIVKNGWINILDTELERQLLPLASYYRNQDDADVLTEDTPLPIGYYSYRRIIRIEPPKS